MLCTGDGYRFEEPHQEIAFSCALSMLVSHSYNISIFHLCDIAKTVTWIEKENFVLLKIVLE